MSNIITKIRHIVQKETAVIAVVFLLGAAGCYLIVTHWDNILWVLTAIGYFIAGFLLFLKSVKGKKKGGFNEKPEI